MARFIIADLTNPSSVPHELATVVPGTVVPVQSIEIVKRSSATAGPGGRTLAALLAKGMKPEMARLTLARKIAAITLTLWKKEEGFDVEQLKTQAA